MTLETHYQESRTKKTQRNQIVNKAFELFRTQGIQNVTMIEIANGAEIQRRTLYNYYVNKDELALEVMKSTYQTQHAVSFYEPVHLGTGYEEVDFILRQLQVYLTENTDIVNFWVQFDYYFQKDYNNRAYDQFLLNRLTKELPLAQSFEKGVLDGSIKACFQSSINQYVFGILNGIIGMAQRVIFREERMVIETGLSKDELKFLVDTLLLGIKA